MLAVPSRCQQRPPSLIAHDVSEITHSARGADGYRLTAKPSLMGA
jgi:hypothetical protein